MNGMRGVYNFFFHPLHQKTEQKAKTVLAVITNIFMTAITGGLWQIPFWIVNRLDNKKIEVLNTSGNSASSKVSVGGGSTAHKTKEKRDGSAQKTKEIAQPEFDKRKAKMATPLFNAVEKGDLDGLRNALTKKLTVNSFNSEGIPLLIFAIQNQKHDIIKYLLDQPNLNINISRVNLGVNVRHTALHAATVLGDIQSVQLLLKKGIEPNIVDADGRAPIHHAIHNNHLEVVKELIVNERVNIHVKDTQEGGYTPILFAIERGRVDIAAELISTKEKELHFEDKDHYGNNIFHLLFEGQSPLTLKRGVDLFKLVSESCPQSIKGQLLNEKNQKNKTPYDLAKEALKEYLEDRESLSDSQQKKYDEMSVLFNLLDPTKY